MIMDAERLKELDELLMSENTQALRITFVDGEIHDLCQFSAADKGECVAAVIQPINATERKRQFFKSDLGMLFNLNEIVEIRNLNTNEVIFRA
jgi:hypothetical protein